jgi:hypothetical protein
MANELRSAFDEFMRAFHRRITTTVLSVSVGQAISLIQCKRPMYLILYNIVCLFRMSIEREGMEIFLGTCGNENIASRPVRVVCNT